MTKNSSVFVTMYRIASSALAPGSCSTTCTSSSSRGHKYMGHNYIRPCLYMAAIRRPAPARRPRAHPATHQEAASTGPAAAAAADAARIGCG